MESEQEAVLYTIMRIDPGAPTCLLGYLRKHPENKVGCVDYSVAKGDKLVAYGWDGQLELDNSKLGWVQP
jgi:hypothetical protein